MSACPADKQLREYREGSSSAADVRALETHLEQCVACCERLEALSAGDDVLDGVIRVMDADSDTVTTFAPSRQIDLDVRAAAAAHIEGYEVVRELGRGGMGVVYLAVQRSTKRKVALKVLLEGPFASASAKRRFEREVEIAARLNHPHVVSIIDSGASSGRYYFAMQYVEGQRLDHYVVEHNLARPQVLRLFQHVCEAVHYAHQQGIIHRDLKPSNILVDEQGAPHVLDFGLARPTDGDVEDIEQAKALSVTGQVIGTLPYMSPEQAHGSRHEIDIRTDVYSLGVILYEMLTGQFPYQVVGQVADVLRNIAETPPKKPSTIGYKINDEVETIVLKALAKEKDRRYQSADNLARDIERYLSGDPIEAKRDSGWYVLRKTLRRYRGPVTVVMLFVVLVAFGGFANWRKNQRLARAASADLLAAFVSAPAQAIAQTAAAPAGVQHYMREQAERDVASSAYTDRVAGARSGWLLCPEAFWHSIDGGPLWRYGEWLELAALPPDNTGKLIAALTEKTRNGKPREKYVAFCLLGQLAPPDAALARLCAEAAQSEAQAGVAAAAAWAAGRLGKPVTLSSREGVFADDLAACVFVRTPPAASFRRGSPPDDPDRYADEDQPAGGLALGPFFIAQTEVTWEAFSRFLADPAAEGFYESAQREGMQNLLKGVPAGAIGEPAVGYVSLRDARAYARWLTAQGEKATPPRRYRLPTEDEWEYAARGGGAGRFCYGDSAAYARYFAHCDGAIPHWQVTARHMPNWFGLFDMHGGVWEWCDSRYPLEGGGEVWVYRGGAFHSPAARCRSAQRNYGSADAYGTYHGMRLVMELVEP